MKFIILGDVHGNLRHCNVVASKYPKKTIIQIGDMGVGFVEAEWIEKLPKNFHFFCGNHDKRSEARTLSKCIGEFGEYKGLFFVSGADSIDKDYRTAGVNWWADEELTYLQMADALEQWEKSKATILLCHDVPQAIATKYYGILDTSKTRNVLQMMVDARKPEKVIYGHHHKSVRIDHDGVQYIGLGIDEVFHLDV